MTTREDSGFTLIELLIAIVIATIVFSVMSASFLVGLRSTDESTTRLLESQDGSFTSVYVAKDVQSAATITLGTAPSGCASVAGTADVVGMTWSEPFSAGPVNYAVVYRFQATTRQLIRYACTPTAASNVIATQLASAPSVTCTPDCSTATTVTFTLTDSVDGKFTISASRRLS